MRFLSEKMYNHSDGFYIYICANCGADALVNHEKEIYTCKNCKGDANIKEIPSSWAAGPPLAAGEIRCMNIGMKMNLQPYRFEVPQNEYHHAARALESVVEE